MFGSKNKQVIFSSSPYSSSRNRRMPRWLMTFLAGAILGGTGFWFLQTNYGPPRISLEEAQRLQQTISDLTQDKTKLEQQLSEGKQALAQAHDTIKQLKPVVATEPVVASGPITPIQEANVPGAVGGMSEIVKNLPPDPSNNPVGVRVGNFKGAMGELNYELILAKRNPNDADVPARVEIVVFGHYRNGNKGFDQLNSLNVTANEYVRLQGTSKLSKPTLTPKTVSVKVIDTQTRKVIGARSFDVQANVVEAEANANPNGAALPQVAPTVN